MLNRITRHERIIKDRAIVADDWAVLRLDEGEDAATATVPEGKVIVPLAVWQAQKATLAARRPLGGLDDRPRVRLAGERNPAGDLTGRGVGDLAEPLAAPRVRRPVAPVPDLLHTALPLHAPHPATETRALAPG